MIAETKSIDPHLKALYEEQLRRQPIVPKRSRSPFPKWHVVQIASGSELTVSEKLKRHDFGVYYPMIRVMKPVPRKLLSRKQRDSGAAISRPQLEIFLPGYMLVHFDMGLDAWHDIFSLTGVRGMWCNGNLPRPMPDELIEAWMSSERDGAIPGGTGINRLFPFKIGETVKIIEGPFAGFEGEIQTLPKGYVGGELIEELDESKRVGLLVHLFGRETRVELSLGQFEKLEPPK